ncbi:MAG: hypothetical protein ACI9T8_000159 [Candidatus Saccharimonadales bacterium]|jgi:hypothetical protein
MPTQTITMPTHIPGQLAVASSGIEGLLSDYEQDDYSRADFDLNRYSAISAVVGNGLPRVFKRFVFLKKIMHGLDNQPLEIGSRIAGMEEGSVLEAAGIPVLRSTLNTNGVLMSGGGLDKSDFTVGSISIRKECDPEFPEIVGLFRLSIFDLSVDDFPPTVEYHGLFIGRDRATAHRSGLEDRKSELLGLVTQFSLPPAQPPVIG